MTAGIITMAGHALSWRVDGDTGAPWLVLSNSLATDLSMWDPQMPSLTRRFRVLRYDTRGHGASGAPPGPYRWDDLVGDVVGLMDHHGIAQATFMGLSLGGMTGLGVALSHAARISRLVCCAARADAPQPVVQGWDERIAAVTQGGMAAVVEPTMARWLMPNTIARQSDLAARMRAMILATNAAGYVACAAAVKMLAYLPDLPRLSVPTLFVAGAQDMGAPVMAMQAMSAAVKGSMRAVVPGAAHIINLDDPDGFGQAILPFLLRSERAAA